MRRRPIDYSLYLVTDHHLARGRPTWDIVAAAVAGGVSCVQLRYKTGSTRAFIEEAYAVQEVLRPAGVPLIINDRVDVALAVGVEGVHLGQTDMPLETARNILGDKAIIGISAECLEDALAAEAGGADYIGVSPIFPTPTKRDTAPPLGLAGLAAIRAAVHVPLVGIGGLNHGNAAQVIRHGGDGLAVVSAIVAADDPTAAARELRRIIDQAKMGRESRRSGNSGSSAGSAGVA